MIHNDTFRKAQLISAVALIIVTWLLSLIGRIFTSR